MTSQPSHHHRDRDQIVDGCEDFAVAARRADVLMPGSTGDGGRWDPYARRILSLLLRAAALSGRSLRDVARWTAQVNPATVDEITTALLLLPGLGPAGRSRAEEISSFYGRYPKGRDSILLTIATHLDRVWPDQAPTPGGTHSGTENGAGW